MQNCSALSESCSASFRGSLAGKESACNASYTGDTDSVPGLGRSPGEGNGSHSSILAWRIPWTEESGGLYIVKGSKSVGHD